MRANDNIDCINFNSNLGVSNIQCDDYKRDLDVSGKDYRSRYGGTGWYKINMVTELRYSMGTRNSILRKFHSIIFLRFPGNILYICFHLYHKTFTDAQLKNKYLTSIDTTVASKILQTWVAWHSSTLSRDSQQVAAHGVASVQHRIIRILIGRSWRFMYNR